MGTYNYNLYKFLTDLVDSIIPTSHCTKDSFTFCEGIKRMSATNRFLIYYNVCSLFPSIPLKETIKIAANLLFNIIWVQTLLEPNQKIFLICSIRYIFSLPGTFHDQIDDVVMGSPLGPVLASLFIGYYQIIWLNTFLKCKIILHRRFADHIICLYNCESDTDQFFQFLNTQDLNIKFTMEKQVNKEISFLITNLITNDGVQL